jgi:hypothetical protein
MNPIDITCPVCAAAPGEECRSPSGQKPIGKMHRARERAKPTQPAPLPDLGAFILVRFGSASTQLARLIGRSAGLLTVTKWRDAARRWALPGGIPERDYRGIPNPTDTRLQHAIASQKKASKEKRP